jgi:hypothetical protein
MSLSLNKGDDGHSRAAEKADVVRAPFCLYLQPYGAGACG